jgi:CubicO group peptidase (beta-lactamase class C family)
MSGKQEADMMGQFPNVSNKQVTLANWRTSPFNQWAFQHVREIVPSANIPNDASQIQNPYREDHDFSSMEIKLVGQRPLTYDEFLKKTGTDGLVILKNGKIIEERYFHGMERNTPHILMSVSKSILGLVTGILIEQKIFIDSDKVCAIIPELGSTAYKEATIRDLLDMRTGVAFVEDYLATSGLMIDYRKATNWNPLEGNESPSDLRSFYGLLNKKNHADGQQFNYVSPNSDLLGWIIERSTGERFSDLLSDLLWKPLGAIMPSYITVDRLGAPRVAGGLCTTTLDLALVGQLFLDKGAANGQQILPESWLQDIRSNGSKEAWENGNFIDYFPKMEMHYRSKWYVDYGPNTSSGDLIFGLGVHGQNLFINPTKRIVVAKFSSQSAPLDSNLIPLTCKWVRTLINQF